MRIQRHYSQSFGLVSLMLVACLVFMPPLHAGTIEEYMTNAEVSFERLDIVESMAWYRRAAEAGHVPAQVRLAYLLDNAEENAEALKWYRLAAQQEDAEAEFGLARLFASGEGVERDYEQAVFWFTRAAQQNYLPAIHVLALAYEKGQLGLQVDYDKTLYWLGRGADRQDHWSIRRLARAYRGGELGLKYDPEAASELERSLPTSTTQGP
jgi:TPR repeat protein